MRSVKRVSAVSGGCARERRVWAMCCFGGGVVIFVVWFCCGGRGRKLVMDGKNGDKLIGGSTVSEYVFFLSTNEIQLDMKWITSL